jgi:hypothetical protein
MILKPLKLLGAVLPVLTVLAFAGAGSASAAGTVLCKEDATPCPSALQYPSGTELAIEGNSTFVSGFTNMECATSMVADAGAASGEPLLAQMTSVEWTNCTSNLGVCTRTALNLPWGSSIAATGGGNGALTVSKPKLRLTCAGTTCEYEASSAKATLTGGNPFTVTASKIELTKTGGGFLCSGTATWAGTYTGTASHNGKIYPTNVWFVTM